VIEGKRINLWTLERHDLIKNYEWGNDPELIRLTGMSPFPKSLFELDRWYDAVCNNPTGRVYSIKTKEGVYVGNIELSSVDTRIGKGEMGMIIGDKAYWDQDYGEEAIKILLDFAFREMRLHRVSASVLEYNTRALKCFKKCGFKEEGVQRDGFYNQGRYWNIIMMGILENEFKAE